MKTYSMSKQDVDYLAPVHANMTALNTAINVYILNVLFPRLGIDRNSEARYDIVKGEIYVKEETDSTVVPKTTEVVPKNNVQEPSKKK